MFRNETKEWYHVRVHGEEIVCTGGHPFYVQGKGFVKAKELNLKDQLTLSDGTQVSIENIEVEKLETPETKYNFEVEDFHTYYVTESNILVHNDCVAKELTKIANKYDNLECVECADEMEAFLKSKGLHGSRVEVRSASDYIISDTFGAKTAISQNGYHVGIKYKGLVFDNIHKTGIKYSLWKADFFSASGVYFPKPIPF